MRPLRFGEGHPCILLVRSDLYWCRTGGVPLARHRQQARGDLAQELAKSRAVCGVQQGLRAMRLRSAQKAVPRQVRHHTQRGHEP